MTKKQLAAVRSVTNYSHKAIPVTQLLKDAEKCLRRPQGKVVERRMEPFNPTGVPTFLIPRELWRYIT
jgi:hypothetical protein